MSGTLTGSTIAYYLYSNASRTVEWGNTIGTNTVSGTAATAVTSLTVYGRVPANASFFAAGGYTDAVTVTVTF
jgi:spore coat protein U-like protein